MWKARYDFTSRESLIEQVIVAIKKGNTKKADGILRHNRDGFFSSLFIDITMKILDDRDEQTWDKFVRYSADRVGPSKETQRNLFGQLFYGNAGCYHRCGSPAMVDTVLVVCQEKGIETGRDIDQDLAFYLQGAEEHKDLFDTVNVLLKHGANMDRALSIQENWASSNEKTCDEEINKLQKRKEESLALLQASKRVAARLKP